MFDLTGKKALVTGGSRGIGQGIVMALAKQGAEVAINYHSRQEEAEKVAVEIKQMGREAFTVQADIAQPDEIARMMADIKTKWGRLDILVNNAGVLGMSPVQEMKDEEWSRVLDTNLKGCFMVTKAVLPMMGGERPGRIINIASIASGQIGIGAPGAAHYDASKAGIIAFSESLAGEVAGKNITVNSVAPGVIATDMVAGIIQNEQAAKGYLARIPKGRWGKPEDIGAAVAFLASDEADYITGTVLYVDGGYLAG